MALRSPTKMSRAASFSLAAVGSLGLLFFIQMSGLNLASYVQYNDNDQSQNVSDGSKRKRHRRDHARWVQQFNDTTEKNHNMALSTRLKEQNNDQISNRRQQQRRQRRDDVENRNMARRSALQAQNSQSQSQSQSQHQLSPACHPHFQAVSSTSTTGRASSSSSSSSSSPLWSNTTKFQRMYFYHARKAGGTSLADYLVKVAHHHGLEFDQGEWVEAEDPGTHEVPTFYVAHLREPVDRSLSHFKYQGRWDCRDLSKIDRKNVEPFVPTEENANKLESWNDTSGHVPTACPGDPPKFKLASCAVNCYTQWFSGLSCPEFNMSTAEQHQAALERLLRYNMIIVLEKLSDPAYAKAVEDFFGVPGVTHKRGAFCEHSSRKANKRVPLEIKNETMRNLKKLNEVDVGLYKGLTDCLDDGGDGQNNTYNFPSWDTSRFDNVTIKFPYDKHWEWKAWRKGLKVENKTEDTINITIISDEDEEEEEEQR